MSKENVKIVGKSVNLMTPIIFVLAILKLAGIIDVSWFWIFFPWILALGIIGSVMIGAIIMFGGATAIDIYGRYRNKKRREKMFK